MSRAKNVKVVPSCENCAPPHVHPTKPSKTVLIQLRCANGHIGNMPSKGKRRRIVKPVVEDTPSWQWLDVGTRGPGGSVTHGGIEYKGEVLSTGGYVMLRNPDADEEPFIAQITELVEYPPDVMPKARVTWMYRASDTRMSKESLRKHDPRELFMSTASDENEIEAIECGCQVLSRTEFAKTGDRLAAFYCTKLYNPIDGSFEPLPHGIATRVGGDAAAIRGAMGRSAEPEFEEDFPDTPDEDSDYDEKAPRTPSRRKRRKQKPAQPPTVRPTKRVKEVARFKFTVPKARSTAAVALNFGDGGALDEARGKLHVSAVPEGLPCREPEFHTICEFVRDQIVAGSGACMFVSGVPGTGKTATIRQVARTLQSERDLGNLVPFDFVEINGMALTTPAQAYCELWDAVGGGAAGGRKVTPTRALELLRKRFTTPSPRRQCTVLLVDELDQLWTRKQDVMYNLFDWPANAHSRLVVVAVANTMDLPERVLVHRVSSRIGLRRLTFAPYTKEQLTEIVRCRLDGLEVFDADAIELCSRKVAAVSGDARRALDLCRRAAELAQKQSRNVTLDDVRRAVAEMSSSPVVAAMESCALHERLLLISILSQFRKTGVEETFFSNVLESHILFCRGRGIEPPSASTVAAVCARLAACRILLAEGGDRDVYQRIRLNCNQDDVMFALRDDPTIQVMKKASASNKL